MRTIKFRALKDDMSNCNWVYGDLVYKNEVPRITTDGGETFHTCLKGTEGQYIIYLRSMPLYSGDIVKARGTKKIGDYITFIMEDAFGFRLKDNKTYLTDCASILGVVEIIGTIHTHPELLKP